MKYLRVSNIGKEVLPQIISFSPNQLMIIWLANQFQPKDYASLGRLRSANALEQVGFTGDPQTHSVAAAILSFIGAGKTGLEVRKKFIGGVYGWPQDGIDAVLTTLLASNHLSAKLNGSPLSLCPIGATVAGRPTKVATAHHAI